MEALYHYLWKHRMFGSVMSSTSGKEVEIIDPGMHNRDAGPDFSSAVIRADGMQWAGNVEIHVKASDWKRHGHHSDPAYDSVILHVVGVNDETVKRTDGTEIMQVQVAPPAEFYSTYALLTESMDTPACLPWLNQIPRLHRSDWMSTLAVERLHDKATYIRTLLETTQGNWQAAIFITLSRALGFGLNGLPFELLAKSLSLNFVMRHRDNPLQVEAMVFGQAGMLDPSIYQYDEYYMLLCREYEFLKQKYGLVPMKEDVWKYSRTRPQNFPHRRLAILSTMLAQGMQLYSLMLEAKGDYDILMEFLDVAASDYWCYHSRFGDVAARSPLPVRLSRSSREILLINVMAPFYMAYGALTGDSDMAEKGIDLLNSLNAEKNSIVSLWESHGLKACSAFDSQALINLKKNYCDKSRCLECRFGHYLLRQSMKSDAART